VDGLATALRDRDWAVAEPVVEALSRIGPPAVPALIDALSDNAVPVRWGAARALGRIGADAHVAVGPLATALADPVMQVRWASARALLAMGATAAPAADALAGALQDDAWVVRWSAARALGSSASGSSLSQSVDALAAGLVDRDSRVCEAAAFALETIGPSAHAAIPALQQASRHTPDEGDQCQVIDAGPAAEQVLIDNGWTVRWASVRALGVVGRDEPRIMNTLMEATQDEVWQVRGVATLALGQFNGRRYPAIVETIVNRIDDESVGVRRAALMALGNAGGTGARDIIVAATDDAESAIRDAASEALKLIDSQGE
jgi:HEAT repeat protein